MIHNPTIIKIRGKMNYDIDFFLFLCLTKQLTNKLPVLYINY